MNSIFCRNIIFLLVFLFFGIGLQAQDYISEQTPEKPEKKGGFQSSRMFFGGDFGLNFGEYTAINFDPLVGYRFTDKFSSGVQLDYSFIHISSLDISTSIYGASVFATHIVYKNLFIRAQYEWQSLESRYFMSGIYSSKDRFSLNDFYVGGGIRTPIGNRSYANLMILWNLNESSLSPYQNPDFRISFEF
jgi:hypothetical protein